MMRYPNASHPLFASLLEALHLNPQDLFGNEDPYAEKIENQLENLLSLEELNALELPEVALPRIYRKLPRLFHLHPPHPIKIKGHFQNLLLIKKKILEKVVLYLYADKAIPQESQVCLFTYVLKDGLGDYYAQMQAAHVLQKTFPSLKLLLVTLLHEQKNTPLDHSSFEHHILYYNDKAKVNFPQQLMQQCRVSSLILQLPTFYPHMQKLLLHLDHPLHELIGELGLIDRGWYHPESGASCMGLHFLEQGIFIKEMSIKKMHFENFKIPLFLFGKQSFNQEDVNIYRASNRFNLNYTKSRRGCFLYLATLLKALDDNDQSIDIISYDLNLLIETIETHFKDNDYAFFRRCGIGKILLYTPDAIGKIALNPIGKTLRLLPMELLCQQDFLTLINFTQDLVGCTGDGSIAEAISADKVFFYDPPYHKRAFLKDLIALAESRLSNFPQLSNFLKAQLPPTEINQEDRFGLWVSEELINPHKNLENPYVFGEILKHPALKDGVKQLNRIIKEEHNFNPILCHLVARRLILKKYPHLEILENETMQSFLEEKINAYEALSILKKEIEKFNSCI